MVLAYVTNRAIMKRDDVCGKAGWRMNTAIFPTTAALECGISIKIDSEWVTKWDAAKTRIEAVKGGRSGAMKRAAVQWGIGRYLYNPRKVCTNISIKQGWHRAKLKDGTGFYWHWSLPGWAIPASDNKPSPEIPTRNPSVDRTNPERLQRLCVNRNWQEKLIERYQRETWLATRKAQAKCVQVMHIRATNKTGGINGKQRTK